MNPPGGVYTGEVERGRRYAMAIEVAAPFLMATDVRRILEDTGFTEVSVLDATAAVANKYQHEFPARIVTAGGRWNAAPAALRATLQDSPRVELRALVAAPALVAPVPSPTPTPPAGTAAGAPLPGMPFGWGKPGFLLLTGAALVGLWWLKDL